MATVVTPIDTRTGGMDWKAVIAGAIAAAAISGLLTAFGAAVGLSMTSAHRNSGFSAMTVAIAAAVWLVMVHVWSFTAGGYLAGRLATVSDLDPQESQFRAGATGFMVWAVGTAVGLVFLMLAAGSIARTTAEVAGRTAAGVADAASKLSTESMSYVADTLLRAQTAPAGATAANAREQRPDPAVAAEVGRVLTVGLAEGSLSSNDRAYLAQVVARQTGLSEADAQRRVEETYARAQSMKDAAERRVREAADKARKQTVVAAFLAAAASLMGLVAAAWAAGVGREHQTNRQYPRILAAERFW